MNKEVKNILNKIKNVSEELDKNNKYIETLGLNKEEIDNLLFLLFNDNITDCGKRKLKNYIVDLQHQLEEKDTVIDEAIEFLKEFHNFENRFKWCEEDYIQTILKLEEILERDKKC